MGFNSRYVLKLAHETLSHCLLFIGHPVHHCVSSLLWHRVYDGCSVNVDTYNNLVSMGFNCRYAAEALKLSNNDLNEALQVSQLWLYALLF